MAGCPSLSADLQRCNPKIRAPGAVYGMPNFSQLSAYDEALAIGVSNSDLQPESGLIKECAMQGSQPGKHALLSLAV